MMIKRKKIQAELQVMVQFVDWWFFSKIAWLQIPDLQFLHAVSVCEALSHAVSEEYIRRI